MFGFSLIKVIFTVAVVVAVWQLFKYLGRLQDEREDRINLGSTNGDAGADGVEDMVLCEVCGSYVARGSKSCGKEGCPFKG